MLPTLPLFGRIVTVSLFVVVAAYGQLTRIPRSMHPLASAVHDAGRAPASLPMERILLQLKSSPEREAALQRVLVEQQDPGSPNYHRWLTPQQFGEEFGAAQQDIDTAVAWLRSQGFQVTEVAAGRRSIEFSGTARNVEQAFHTEIHRYAVGGESHVANSTDISIPSALASVVAGVVTLNNFHSRPMHHTVRPRPLANLVNGGHALAPYDFAAIYNVAALWSIGFDGTGQSIAIPGRSNIDSNDITTFRSTFGLPGNNTQIIVNGRNPGVVDSKDETEADLDVEWAGAVAKNATIDFVVSADTNATDGVILSSAYIVNHDLASVMSVSFGACEAYMGPAGQYFRILWSQAAAEGISVFVAAGDSGPAACDASDSNAATHGFGVNGLASTPYNVAVGGTQFNDGSFAAYWNGSNDTQKASAIGYVPEVAWNETSGGGLWAGAGGVSSEYSTPPWQTGPGVPTSDPFAPSQHHRYLPDVSLASGGYDGYLIYREGGSWVVGGTSAASPAFAGIMAIIDQYSGGRNGNPNPRFYALGSDAPSVFHDVVSGSTAVPCGAGTPNCSATDESTTGMMTGYNTASGYDLATGWGSVDAYELALNWAASAQSAH